VTWWQYLILGLVPFAIGFWLGLTVMGVIASQRFEEYERRVARIQRYRGES